MEMTIISGDLNSSSHPNSKYVTDPKYKFKYEKLKTMKTSDRIADILANKLHEFGNKRGNIIYNSLGKHKRSISKHKETTTPVADPHVYNILGKLHQRTPVRQRSGDSRSKLEIKQMATSL